MRWHGNLLYVRDLKVSLRFYHDALGLPMVMQPAPHLAIIGLDNGSLYLHADPSDAPAWLTEALEAGTRGAGVICHLEVKDVGALRDDLVAKGIEISRGPEEAHGQLQLYVYDPDGYNLVFVQQLDEHRQN